MQDGMFIDKIRSQYHLSQKEMAQVLHITLSSYKLYEANIRPMKIEELNQISNYFKISLNTLLGLSKNTSEFGPFDLDLKYLKFSLKYVRKIHRVTQQDLAKEFKISIPTIHRYEKNPQHLKVDYLRFFATKFHVSVDYICGKTLKKEVL